MPVKDIICPICTEVFKNNDDIHSTSCGHLFHFSCFNNWRIRDLSCPQCRQNNPLSYKLYLTFDESDVNLEVQREIQLKLDKSNEKITKLLVELSQGEDNFLKLQNQFTNIEKLKQGLEDRIRQRKESEQNLSRLQRQYKESLDLTKQLEHRVEELFIENETISKELRLKKLENETLTSGLDVGQSNLSDSELCEKIKTLEQRHKYFSDKLLNEVDRSTQLSIDIMKLKVCINHLNSVEKTETANDKKSSSIQKTNKENTRKKVFKENTNPKENDSSNNSVFIKDLPSDQLTIPVENVIVNLAAKMKLSITVDDLIKVEILENSAQNSSKVHLFVQFKSSKLTSQFLSSKNLLRNDPKTKSIFIAVKFIKDHSLFLYAKEKLAGNGFDHVYCKDDKVFAKKNRSDPRSIYIHNKAEVDKLRAKHNLPAKSN